MPPVDEPRPQDITCRGGLHLPHPRHGGDSTGGDTTSTGTLHLRYPTAAGAATQAFATTTGILGLANTIVTVYTGATVDDYGDPTDGNTIAASNLAASITEKTRRIYRYDSDTPRTVRWYAVRLPNGTPVSQGDRIVDSTGTAYLVDGVTQQVNPVMACDLTLECRRA